MKHDGPSILQGIGADRIRTDPFPHIVVSNVFEAAAYEALAAGFPSFSQIAWSPDGRRFPNNKRYAATANRLMQMDDIADCWKQFVARHSSQSFLLEVATLFAGYWPRSLLRALEGRFDGHSTGRLDFVETADFRIRLDARAEINTPVYDKASTPRGPHLDSGNRLYSGLFYLRAPDDDSAGGELVLYRWCRRPETVPNVFQLPADAVEEVISIPYAANQLVMFPQCIDALHGVGLRHPTPHLRRYVFLTAEIGEDWLVSPGQD